VSLSAAGSTLCAVYFRIQNFSLRESAITRA